MTPLALIILLISPGEMAACKAVRVVDGDTLRADCQGSEPRSWRLYGVDTPERGQPGFSEAADAFRAMLETPVLIGQQEGQDGYGRPVVRLMTPDGNDLSCDMVAGGWARDWPRYSGGEYAACEK